MTVEKETVNYSGQRTDFYLKHIFRSVEEVQRPLITVDEIRRIKPPTKAPTTQTARSPHPVTCSYSSTASLRSMASRVSTF